MIQGFPKGFPFSTLPVQRALAAVSQRNPESLAVVIDALFHAVWVEGNTAVGEPNGFTPVLESVLGKQETQEVLSAVSKSQSCQMVPGLAQKCDREITAHSVCR